jgi:hypothetical protein
MEKKRVVRHDNIVDLTKKTEIENLEQNISILVRVLSLERTYLFNKKEKGRELRVSAYFLRNSAFDLSMLLLRSILAGQTKTQCPQPSQRSA